VFAQNNLYAIDSTLNGEIFTNNDLNFTGTTVNGDLYAAGKGNGQKNVFDSTEFNKYQGSGGNVNVWDPTTFQNGSSVTPGTVNYHTSIKVTNSNVPNTVKNSNSFIPPIGNPTFDFTGAKNIATANGTYYASMSAFTTYLASIGTVSGNTVTYNLPSGLYFVDCSGAFCSLGNDLFNQDSNGHYVQITGTGVSIVMNNWFLDLGGITINSPYSYNGGYYPALATNGDMYLLQGVLGTQVSVNLNGVVYANGSLNSYGLATNDPTVITGAAWAANQLNLWSYSVLTFLNTYVQGVQGFNFSNDLIHSISWSENP
jgi:hypothetical protein